MSAAATRDYSLIGPSARAAEKQGLVAVEWYHSDVPRKRMKELMRRSDGAALRHTGAWFSLLVVTGIAGGLFWGSWQCIPFFACYGVLYGSTSGAAWHEFGHGTAFRTAWINDTLYQIASFMTLNEPTVWRWSHARHHTDTNIVGRDREIVAMRPPDLLRLAVDLVGVRHACATLLSVVRHACGHLTEEELSFVPEAEARKVYREARAWLAIFVGGITLSVAAGSLLPALYVGLPSLYGRWLDHAFALTQHAALPEDVTDHRLNTRTIYVNPVLRFLYWNMNYHVEHHMFPMVPYHALPGLHAEIRPDLPEPYQGLLAAYREIIPALRRQLHEPEYHVARRLPASARPFRSELHDVVFEV